MLNYLISAACKCHGGANLTCNILLGSFILYQSIVARLVYLNCAFYTQRQFKVL